MLPGQSSALWGSLKRGDDEIGQIRVEGAENFHIYGRFRAGPQFAKYEPLFVRAYERSWQGHEADWIDIQEEVDALGLYLGNPVTGNATRIRDFQLEALNRVWDKEGVPVEFKFISA